LEDNQTSFDGQPDNSYRPPPAAGAATARDKITERRCGLFGFDLHDL